jgi:hypothetical protein
MSAKNTDQMDNTVKSSKRRNVIVAVIVVTLCAVGLTAFFVLSALQSSRAQLEYTEYAQRAIATLFEDDTHSSLAYFDSEDSGAFDRAFNEARRFAERIEDKEVHQDLIILSDEARILYSEQLRAHAMVEGLFCDTFSTCPEPPHSCFPSIANTEENIAAAYDAVIQVSNERVRDTLLKRLQMLEEHEEE